MSLVWCSLSFSSTAVQDTSDEQLKNMHTARVAAIDASSNMLTPTFFTVGLLENM